MPSDDRFAGSRATREARRCGRAASLSATRHGHKVARYVGRTQSAGVRNRALRVKTREGSRELGRDTAKNLRARATGRDGTRRQCVGNARGALRALTQRGTSTNSYHTKNAHAGERGRALCVATRGRGAEFGSRHGNRIMRGTHDGSRRADRWQHASDTLGAPALGGPRTPTQGGETRCRFRLATRRTVRAVRARRVGNGRKVAETRRGAGTRSRDTKYAERADRCDRALRVAARGRLAGTDPRPGRESYGGKRATDRNRTTGLQGVRHAWARWYGCPANPATARRGHRIEPPRRVVLGCYGSR